MREQLPNGSTRNKIEFLADQVELIKGVKLPVVSELPPATKENEGVVLALAENSKIKTDFDVEYLLNCENIVVASSVTLNEIAISYDYGKSFIYRDLPTPHVAPINGTSKGKLFRMGVHPSSNGLPLLIYGTKSAHNGFFLSKDLGATWENLTEKLTSVPVITELGLTVNALSWSGSTAYDYSASVDGDLIAVNNRSYIGSGGLAFSTDGGETFKAYKGSNPDHYEDEDSLAWKLGVTDVYDLCVCDDGINKFGILHGETVYNMAFNSGITFESIQVEHQRHGYYGLGLDPIRNDIYLMNRIDPKGFTRCSKSSRTASYHLFPEETYAEGYNSTWEFGHAAKDGGGQISIYDGKMVIGRKINVDAIGVYIFNTDDLTAKRMKDIELSPCHEYLLEFTGQASIYDGNVLFIQNSQLYRSSNGFTLDGPNPKSLNVVMSYDGAWGKL